MLTWENLLNNIRLKDLYGAPETMGTAGGRTECERDYDRILFATPTRRLADKTQVFPMEVNDSVRTRLTHSHEVSNLARSIGVRLAFEHADSVFGADHERLQVKRNVPSILAAVGLAHDLGNPPFGHQGEKAIQQWFHENKASSTSDFLEFDGNAQTFRLLTRLQLLNDRFGLNLTIGTLGALIKYPSIYGAPDRGGFKKFGIFKSEEDIVKDVWKNTGLGHGIRHPLAYVMEACDDIAYSVIDAEDTIKKGYASFYDLIDFLSPAGSGDAVIEEVKTKALEKNKEFKKAELSSRELNDISMQMFRVKAIYEMVKAATETYVSSNKAMLEGKIPSGFELMKNSSCAQLCSEIKKFARMHGFQNKEVLRLELKGNRYIRGLMDILWRAINQGEDPGHPFERFVFGSISENYRRVFRQSIDKNTAYARCQLLCDAISGMTENHLVEKYTEFKALENAPA